MSLDRQPTAADTRTWFTVAEVAKRYGVTEATVRTWVMNGELRAVDTGRRPGSKRPRLRISLAALEAFELIRSTSPPQPRAPRRKRHMPDVIEFYK